ncbi:MAG: formate dehydrogenase subunit delta [Alphaproteobacteria bacterium]
MSLDRLVYMANQIGKFFAHMKEAEATAAIADHIEKFWDPRMRKQIIAHLEASGGKGLDPLALAAVNQLQSQRAQAAATPR